jgi:glycine/D-amino acid oxidase-like deaminating enzyme
MFALSHWEYEQYFKEIDFTIVGSGIVGLCTAISLREKFPASKIVVLERSFLPYGASTRNAGFACFGSLSELIDDAEKMGIDAVMEIVEMRIKGLELLKQYVGESNMDYKHFGGYELFRSEDKKLYDKCLPKIDEFNTLLKPLTAKENTFSIDEKCNSNFGFEGIHHSILNSAEGQIDTGLMMQSLLKKVRSLNIEILNGIEVFQYEENNDCVEVFTKDKFSFKTKKLIVCTNAFAQNIIPSIDVAPKRAQVLITGPIENLKVNGTFHFDEGYYYFRNINNRILLGGARNMDFEGESTDQFGTSELLQHKLETILSQIILLNTSFKIERRWSGIMGFGSEKKPILTQLSPNTYCAVRMSGMGVAIGSMIGKKVVGLIDI